MSVQSRPITSPYRAATKRKTRPKCASKHPFSRAVELEFVHPPPTGESLSARDSMSEDIDSRVNL